MCPRMFYTNTLYSTQNGFVFNNIMYLKVSTGIKISTLFREEWGMRWIGPLTMKLKNKQNKTNNKNKKRTTQKQDCYTCWQSFPIPLSVVLCSLWAAVCLYDGPVLILLQKVRERLYEYCWNKLLNKSLGKLTFWATHSYAPVFICFLSCISGLAHSLLFKIKPMFVIILLASFQSASLWLQVVSNQLST